MLLVCHGITKNGKGFYICQATGTGTGDWPGILDGDGVMGMRQAGPVKVGRSVRYCLAQALFTLHIHARVHFIS